MTMLAVPPGYWINASIRTGRLVAGPPAESYPCFCDEIDDDPPEWLKEAVRRDGGNARAIRRCRPYLAKKGRNAGRWTARCDCWGRRRDDDLPGGCCANHEHNPAYDVTGALGIATVAQPATVYAASGLPEPDDGLDAEERLIHDWAAGSAPYVRRFTHAELHCPCATPWDGITDARKVGYHCSGCHQNFVNWRRAQAHQKYVTMACKDPRTQVTIDGVPVYRATTLGGFVVWN
jgi:hypothetical protein